MADEADGSGVSDSANQNTSIDLTAPEVQQAIKDRVAEATKELSKKIDEFRQNNIDLMKQAKVFESFGNPDDVKKKLELLKTDELGRLLASGEHEQWFAKRSEQMRSDYEQRMESVANENEQLKKENVDLQQRIFALHISTDVQREASALGKDGRPRVNPDGVEVLVERASRVWREEGGKFVPRKPDGTRWLSKDGQSDISVAEWIESQRERSPSLFPAPISGTGARTSQGKFSAQDIANLSPIEKMNLGRQSSRRAS